MIFLLIINILAFGEFYLANSPKDIPLDEYIVIDDSLIISFANYSINNKYDTLFYSLKSTDEGENWYQFEVKTNGFKIKDFRQFKIIGEYNRKIYAAGDNEFYVSYDSCLSWDLINLDSNFNFSDKIKNCIFDDNRIIFNTSEFNQVDSTFYYKIKFYEFDLKLNTFKNLENESLYQINFLLKTNDTIYFKNSNNQLYFIDGSDKSVEIKYNISSTLVNIYKDNKNFFAVAGRKDTSDKFGLRHFVEIYKYDYEAENFKISFYDTIFLANNKFGVFQDKLHLKVNNYNLIYNEIENKWEKQVILLDSTAIFGKYHQFRNMLIREDKIIYFTGNDYVLIYKPNTNSIESIFNSSEFIIYPNPFISNLSIKSNKLIDKIEIFNLLGEKVFSDLNIYNLDNIDLRKIESGQHFLIIYSNKKEYVYLINKQ